MVSARRRQSVDLACHRRYLVTCSCVPPVWRSEAAIRGWAVLGVGRMDGDMVVNGGADRAPLAKCVRNCSALIVTESKNRESGVSKGDGDCRAEPASQLGSWRPRRWNGFPFGRARQS